MKKHRLLIIGLMVIFMSSFISAVQVCEDYDNFSNGSLDLNKWEEISPTISEHLVQNGVYHTAQITSSDRRVSLNVKNRQFSSGDIIEYDVNYISGNGNRISRAYLDNGNVHRTLVGYWNAIAGVGNDLGLYHIKVNFTNNGADIEITRPDESIGTLILVSPGTNHTYGFTTRTGGNGIVHMDYDNVVVCSEQEDPEPPQIDLEQRVFELEQRFEGMENKTTLIEGSLIELQEFFDNFVGNFEEFLNGLPRGLLN